MKKQISQSLGLVLMIILSFASLSAQDIKGEVIKYQETIKYNFREIFHVHHGNQRVNDWIASLPTESKRIKTLTFTDEFALFEDDPDANAEVSPQLQGALSRANYVRPPVPELLKIYYDLEKNKSVQQIEFMTRKFLITGRIEKKAWKLKNKMVKILDYTCMCAEMKKDDDIITAWFTTEIPVSIGPAMYSGLPGIILAIDINGETAFLATSIDLNTPKENTLKKPDEGKKITQEKFSKIMAEKVQEFKETRVRKGIIGRRHR